MADEGIATDRPDFVESSDVVAKGKAQLELDWNVERDKSTGQKSRQRSTPALLRIGLGNNLEARIETDGLLTSSTTDTTTSITTRQKGTADVALGLK
jgi:hypothetical protein